jgi:hypothetical protein
MNELQPHFENARNEETLEIIEIPLVADMNTLQITRHF